jgi:L-ribulose-5-phosphate 3-epimerase
MRKPETNWSRRRFLGRSAQAAVGAALAAHYGPLVAAPGKRWFKIGACAWLLAKPSPACLDLAKQIGLDGVQLHMDRDVRKPEVQRAYREAMRRTGMEISSLSIGELCQVPLKSDDPQAPRILSESLDVCRALGLKIAMPAFFGRGELDMDNRPEIDRVVRVLKEAAVRAEKEGMLIALENYLSAEDNLRIIERIGSPVLRVYYDVGNSTDKGRDVYREIRRLGKLICEFHAKDGRFLLGRGRIDFKRVRQAIDDIGFSGWIHLEAARPNGVLVDYAAQGKFLRAIFPER